jgi:hypothetical protein
MEFGITDITNGWFNWYLKDNEKKVEITASRYAEVDFVKQFLVNLTELVRDKKEKRFSVFTEPGFITVNMSIDQNKNFNLELAFEYLSDLPDEDMKKTKKYYKFVASMYQMRTEFVPTVLKAFKRYERSHLMLDCYEENWTLAIGGMDSEKFIFPFNELQELHLTASDIRIK